MCMQEKILITNIQRFSLHDGPGIRTTVFCKGCSLHCPWCSNPENIMACTETYHKDGKEGVYGSLVSCNEIYEAVMRDRPFYARYGDAEGLNSLPGGVTFSGGEPLLQIECLEPLLKKLRTENVHICAETCLFVSENQLRIAMEYVDLFYVDVKILDTVKCKTILGGKLEQYLKNLEILFQTKKQTVFRIPVISGYTDDKKNCDAVIKLIQQYQPLKVELIKEHNLGQSKYQSLGRKPPVLGRITDDFMERYGRKIENETRVQTEVCII